MEQDDRQIDPNLIEHALNHSCVGGGGGEYAVLC